MSDKLLTVEQLIDILKKYNHKELHVHHTWKPEHKDFKGNNYRSLQNGMRNYHKNNLGWVDIGQHVTLFPDGKFLTGRDFGRTPASIKGYNTGGFAVEMLGNFDKGHDNFDGKQKESIIKLAKWFDSKGRYIRFHRENSGKTCPGSGISKSKFMAEVRGSNTIKPSKPVQKPPQNKIWRNYINGSIVRDLQRELNRQFNKGLKVDGWFGQNTINALVNVRQGARGNLTRIIQRRLTAKGYRPNFGVDGSFGPSTLARVRQFQKANILAVDGIVGKNTWKALFKK